MRWRNPPAKADRSRSDGDTHMVTALVTGGTGFIGSHIARALIASGHTARVLRRESSPLTALEGLTVEHAIGDVTDPASLLAAMDGCEWVFHVAAVADYWRADTARMYQVNVDGTRFVLEAARKAHIKRVLFTSSGAALGRRAHSQPIDESLNFNGNPKRFPYGHTKALAEQEAARAVAQGQDVVILNPSVVMGPGDLNQISGSLMLELKRGGVPAIPPGGVTLIDVRDVAAAHLMAATVGRSGERYLLGAFDVRWQTITALSAEIVGVRPPPIVFPVFLGVPLGAIVDGLRTLGVKLAVNGDQIRQSTKLIYFDCHKAWQAFGQPQIPLQRMLQDTYDWYVAHGIA